MQINKISIVGLGYVGLPIAFSLAEKFEEVVGFDIDQNKIDMLSKGEDYTKEFSREEVLESKLKCTSDSSDLKDSDVFIVTVPTPVDKYNTPDLSYLEAASTVVGQNLKKGSLVIYESTVYPGVTREECAPILEKFSGLKSEIDFKLGYSPERINPGDSKHSIEKVIKVVSAQDDETLEVVASLYEQVIPAGVFKASSIEVAEACKVIENTQRDLNIALMNELAIIFDKLDINTSEVLEAAGTKWNFLKFKPGLVGGHCIGVDPYYLTSKAEQIGYHPQVILAGRRINDSMGIVIASKAVKLLAKAGKQIRNSKALVCGLTFKENVADTRNSRVPQIIEELTEYGVDVNIVDPWVERKYLPGDLNEKFIDDLESLKPSSYDVVILAVSHEQFVEMGSQWIEKLCADKGIFIDVKSCYEQKDFGASICYWAL